VYDGVHNGPILGSGVSGIVRKVNHRSTGVSYAVKCLDVGLLQDFNGYERLKDEVFIMCKLDHPNIVRLEEVYESQSELYLIQELCLGGDLFDRLDDQPDIHYTEAQCARLVKQMLSSVRYLHSKNIIHRDLKLENFLFSSSKPDSELKMIDFGLSKHFLNGQIHNDPVGTPYTVAPEVILGSYDERCDLWSVGVIAYLLLCGETPFGGTDGEALSRVRENILYGRVSFEPSDVWENVSDAGKAFVKRLLDRDSSKRPTAREAQHDPWIKVYANKKTKEGKCLSPHIASALVEFKVSRHNVFSHLDKTPKTPHKCSFVGSSSSLVRLSQEYSDMRKMLCEVLSFTLLPEQIVELRGEFEKMDHDGDGEISLSALKHVFMESAESGCLGALTEVEVEEIFNALRVRKTEPTIRWHEFIAASLSQCNFDERNLRLAFDRLDYDRKG
jgi:calcium-dependent protein kinase